jgi:hypothetical protein
LANDPWFVLKREHIILINKYIGFKTNVVKNICNGGLANESLFAIILHTYTKLNDINVINSVSHITDWARMTSTTSPHLFKDANQVDINFIDKSLKENKYAMFIRKIDMLFPDEVLKKYIYN